MNGNENGNDSVDQEGLTNFLSREFTAKGQLGTGTGDEQEFDANDVAAYVRGGLLPGRRAAFQHAMLQDPDLRAAVAFEQETRRAEGRASVFQKLAAAVIAAAVIAIMIFPFALRGEDEIAKGRRLLEAGDAVSAVEVLESAYAKQRNLDNAQVLALARHMAGDSEPLAGLDLGPRGDWRPLGDDDLTVPPTVRGEREPAIGLHGSVLNPRPVITIKRGAADLSLILYRADDQAELMRRVIPGGEKGESVAIALPDDASDLVPGVSYGLDLRLGRDLVAHSDFRIADKNDAAACNRIERAIADVIKDADIRAELQGNLFLRRGFYAAAVRTWSSIPTDRRSAGVKRALDVALLLLWNG